VPLRSATRTAAPPLCPLLPAGISVVPVGGNVPPPPPPAPPPPFPCPEFGGFAPDVAAPPAPPPSPTAASPAIVTAVPIAAPAAPPAALASKPRRAVATSRCRVSGFETRARERCNALSQERPSRPPEARRYQSRLGLRKQTTWGGGRGRKGKFVWVDT
jgi:hypothetical protein